MVTQFKVGWVKLCLLFAMCLFALQAMALQAIPTLTSSVTDLTQTLSSQEQQALANKLEQFSQEKGSQVVVLIVPTTQPEEIDQYSIRVADEWKIGREKEDDGVIIVVAKDDRKMRIEVGYGLEGAIPDAYAKRIIEEQMKPRFKQGNFYAGLDVATDKIIGLTLGEDLPPPSRTDSTGSVLIDYLPVILFVTIMTGFLLRAIFGSFMGSALNGGLVGLFVWGLGAMFLTAGLAGIFAFIFTMANSGRGGVPTIGGYPGGGRSSGGFGGGFGGGGGGFGGGGASGSW